MSSQSFKDDLNSSPAERAMIKFEVELNMTVSAARENKGFSMAQLAQKAGVKPAVVSRIENLYIAPKLETIFKLLTFLGYKLTIAPSDHGPIDNSPSDQAPSNN
ncbi:MAG: helix-turn-helix domain-containing protein [Deltaproteobacteria bacterium]|jgi:ribosome-binding protein aMBF1 (putative translation factor)|nr:helix-turn-helix domain-containing protein [Deltaproteobacteria bacterium]